MFDDANHVRQLFALVLVLAPWSVAALCIVTDRLVSKSFSFGLTGSLNKVGVVFLAFGGLFFAPWAVLLAHSGFVTGAFRLVAADFGVLTAVFIMIAVRLNAARWRTSRPIGLLIQSEGSAQRFGEPGSGSGIGRPL